MAASWQTRRSIPPILDDPRAASLTLTQRHTLVLLPLAVDDHGRALDDAGRLNGILWGPLWREHGPDHFESDLAALAAAGLITRYAVDGVAYLQVRDWDAQQVISRRSPSQYPAPPVAAGAPGGHAWGVSGESGERVNAKVRASVDAFVESVQHAAERLQDPAVQSNAADYLARLAGNLDPAWGEKVRTRANDWIRTNQQGRTDPAAGPTDAPGSDDPWPAATDDPTAPRAADEAPVPGDPATDEPVTGDPLAGHERPEGGTN